MLLVLPPEIGTSAADLAGLYVREACQAVIPTDDILLIFPGGASAA